MKNFLVSVLVLIGAASWYFVPETNPMYKAYGDARTPLDIVQNPLYKA